MSRDLRKFARQTTLRLIIGGLALVFIVGLGLIYWRFGSQAALLGFLCLLGGLSPIGLILLAFWIMERISKHANRQ